MREKTEWRSIRLFNGSAIRVRENRAVNFKVRFMTVKQSLKYSRHLRIGIYD
jgi:hypothetical protein